MLVVVSVVEIAIGFVTLVAVAIVFSAGFVGTNCIKLPPSALFIALVIRGAVVVVVVVVVVVKSIMKSSFC